MKLRTGRLGSDAGQIDDAACAALALGLSAALNAPIPEMKMGVIRM